MGGATMEISPAPARSRAIRARASARATAKVRERFEHTPGATAATPCAV